jgi:N-glycosylase/DNA lyase
VVTGVLAPQVNYDTASATSQALLTANLMPCRDKLVDYEIMVYSVLSQPQVTQRGPRRYRFPNRAARLLGRIHSDFHRKGIQLQSTIASSSSPSEVRKQLMLSICGFGPKQATMFLRDCGVTDQLAIIDRHIVRYMYMLKLINSIPNRVAEPMYYGLETAFLAYAEYVGVAPGVLDWAIWVTMRNARIERCA